MKHVKASFITASIAALLITANAVGAIHAFEGSDAVPSYETTTPPASPVLSPNSENSVSQEDAVAAAKSAVENEFDMELTDLYTAVAAESEYEGSPAWYVSFSKNFCEPQLVETDGEIWVSDCYTVYIDSNTADVLSAVEGEIAVQAITSNISMDADSEGYVFKIVEDPVNAVVEFGSPQIEDK